VFTAAPQVQKGGFAWVLIEQMQLPAAVLLLQSSRDKAARDSAEAAAAAAAAAEDACPSPQQAPRAEDSPATNCSTPAAPSHPVPASPVAVKPTKQPKAAAAVVLKPTQQLPTKQLKAAAAGCVESTSPRKRRLTDVIAAADPSSTVRVTRSRCVRPSA